MLLGLGGYKTIQIFKQYKLKHEAEKQELQLKLKEKQKETQNLETQNKKLQDEKKDLEIKLQAKRTSVRLVSYSGDALSNIIRVESGGNPLAVNRSSGACGLGQSLPCSKMLNALGVTRLEDASYEAQREWVRQYCIKRYGSPENAWAFWESHRWY